MWKLLQLLLFGHTHKWVPIETIPVLGAEGATKGSRVAYMYVQRCAECGQMNHYRVKG